MAIVTDPDNIDRYQFIFGSESQEISIFPVGAQVNAAASGVAAETSAANPTVFRDPAAPFTGWGVAAGDVIALQNGPAARHFIVSAVTNASTLEVALDDGFAAFTDASALVYAIVEPSGGSCADGIAKQAAYSFTKEEWRVDAFSSTAGAGDDMIRHEFPFEPITSESMEIGGGDTHKDWQYVNTYTRKKIRTGGWSNKNAATSTITENAGVITLGSINATAQVYFQQVSAQNVPVDFTFLGGVNEAIETYTSGAGAVTPTDYRTFLKLFLRQKYYTYAGSQISDIGVSQLQAIVNRFPLTHTADTAITASDGQILGLSPYRAVASGVAADTDGETTKDTVVFTDSNADFLVSDVAAGDTLRIAGGADVGTYAIASVGTTTLDIEPNADTTVFASTDTALTYSINTTFIVASTGAGVAGTIQDLDIEAGVSAGVAIASSDLATFVSDGVVAGDILEIASATSDHEGMYVIASVVSEKRLWVDATDNDFTAVAGVDYRIREPGMYFQYKKEIVSLAATGDITFASTTGKATRGAGDWGSDGVTEGTVLTFASTASNNTCFTVASAGTTDVEFVSSDWSRLVDETVGASTTAVDGFKRTINNRVYGFNWKLLGNVGTAAECYEFHQHQMRQTGDIDWGPGAFRGDVNDLLLAFATPTGVTTNLHIDSIHSDDTNNVTYGDACAQARTYPFVSSLTINFNVNLQNDSDALYRMFFTTNPAGNYGTKDAVTVEDGNGDAIAGAIGGAASVALTYDYDGNVQGGRSPGTNAAVTIVAIGLNTAQFVITTGTITRAKGLSFSLTSSLERNYTT